jgi:diguanylate cyclase (GGDEF)-like protein
MPQSDLAAARSAAEKLRQAIEQHRYERIGTVTVSLGVAALGPLDNANMLLKRVDDALYLAKENGRNRVETLAAEATAGGAE